MVKFVHLSGDVHRKEAAKDFTNTGCCINLLYMECVVDNNITHCG
jgi:hypothetical protein